MKNIQDSLETLGFNTKETKIILTLTAKGSSTVSALARMIKIPRTTISPILQKLKKRGLIRQTQVSGHQEWELIELKEFYKKLDSAIRVFKD